MSQNLAYAAPQPAPPAGPRAAGRTAPLILVVDDDRITRLSLVAMLEDLGYNVAEAADGRQALDVLKSVVLAAMREAQTKRVLATELHKHRTSFNLIESSAFRLKSIAEAENLSVFLANCFPSAERVVGGLAELLVNAVEHGNMEIGYALKSELISQGTWSAEIERRSFLAQYNQRHVDVFYKKAAEGHYVVIRDMGVGFEWKNYLFVDPARAMDNHGRGIAQANALSFDRLVYNEAGNEVTAFCSEEAPLEW